MAGERVVCMQCDLPPERCVCDKYCNLCKGTYGVRMCVDGMYYCPDCREACDVRWAENHG